MMEREELDSVIDDITYLAERRDASKIRTIIVSVRPADLADILSHLNEDARVYVFSLLSADQASDVLPELDDFTRTELVALLEHQRLSEIVDEMASDEAAEFVADLPADVARSVLQTMNAEDSAEVRELLEHEEETAGRIMQLELVAVPESSTVDEAIQAVRQRAEEVEHLYNVYAVDAGGRLTGVLPLKRLVLARPHAVVRDVMTREVISVRADVDQEQVAQMFRRYDLVALPVVDAENRLVGRVTVDDALEILEDEVTEDIHRMAGLDPEEEYRETSALRASRARLPWLVLGMCGGILAALQLARHEHVLEEMVGLAFFVPIVMGMGGNSGFQASTIVVRALALGEISMRSMGVRLLKELRVGMLNGLFCGMLMFAVVSVWRGPLQGAIIALSLQVVIIVAATIGSLVPIILHRFGVDPGLATGPFITSSNDVIALAIYMTIAVNLMRH